MNEGQPIGLHYLDGTFADREDVTRRVLLRESLVRDSTLRHITEFPPTKDFEAWSDLMRTRQRERKEISALPEFIQVEIDTDSPILLGLFGDVHIGDETADYDRFARDIDLITSVNGYSIAVGDLTDSYFFMPGVGQQIASGQEQVLYMRAALAKLGKDNKLIAAFLGDHDTWIHDKMGAHALYDDFTKRFGGYLLDGISYIGIGLNNGEKVVNYPFVGSHRHKGFSIYNDAHASWRQYLDESTNSTDTELVSFTAHKHTKAYLKQVRKVYSGKEIFIHALTLGSYQESNRYSRKHGWPRKGEKAMGAFGLILHPGEQAVDVFWSIEDAVEQLGRLSS